MPQFLDDDGWPVAGGLTRKAAAAAWCSGDEQQLDARWVAGEIVCLGHDLRLPAGKRWVRIPNRDSYRFDESGRMLMIMPTVDPKPGSAAATILATATGLVYDQLLFYLLSAAPAQPRYGEKGALASAHIKKHREEFLLLSDRQLKKRIAVAVGCSESTALTAIKTEKLPGGQLHVQK